MTLPTLVDNYYKQVAEARLKKFYSAYNQAILLAEAKYGPKEYWTTTYANVEFDDEGNATTTEADKWFSTYLENLMTIKKKINTNGSMLYYLNDGSQFMMGTSQSFFGDNIVYIGDIYFYPFGNFESCSKKGWDGYGKCAFIFSYCPTCTEPFRKNKGLEPYLVGWDGNYNTLLRNGTNGCNADNNNNNRGAWCTAVIQMNGWKVPKNYPYKIHP